MAIETQISNNQYECMALAEPDRGWELWDGHLREKPGMTYAHNTIGVNLGYMLMSQLDWATYEVRIDAGRVYRPESTYFVPDVFVFPKTYVTPHLRHDDVLEVYVQPLTLVVEIWSRSTGGYDLSEKVLAYQERGDREIWLIHPYERTLTAWRRQPDGTYTEHVYREGLVHPATLPGVAIDLDLLFAE